MTPCLHDHSFSLVPGCSAGSHLSRKMCSAVRQPLRCCHSSAFCHSLLCTLLAVCSMDVKNRLCFFLHCCLHTVNQSSVLTSTVAAPPSHQLSEQLSLFWMAHSFANRLGVLLLHACNLLTTYCSSQKVWAPTWLAKSELWSVNAAAVRMETSSLNASL